MTMTREQLLRAYTQLKTIREFEERLHVEIATGEIAGFTHLYSGQEAIAVGVCENLNEDDYIVSTHRGHGHCIAKGGDVIDMMKEIYGSSEGLCKGKGGSMHIADFDKGILGANGIVGGGPPISVGAALAAKMRGEDKVSVSFNGDGSSNQGTVFEAMNLAVVLKVPAVFVYENNGYGEHTGADYAVGGDMVKRVEGFGIPVFSANGTDFFDVYDASQQAIEHARKGNGPSAIYARSLRYFGHFEGDPQAYRAKDEVKNARTNDDCISNFTTRVLDEGWLEQSEIDTCDGMVSNKIDEAVAAARAAPRPALSDIHDDVYINY